MNPRRSFAAAVAIRDAGRVIDHLKRTVESLRRTYDSAVTEARTLRVDRDEWRKTAERIDRDYQRALALIGDVRTRVDRGLL